jgi:hypothetical protein
MPCPRLLLLLLLPLLAAERRRLARVGLLVPVEQEEEAGRLLARAVATVNARSGGLMVEGVTIHTSHTDPLLRCSTALH